MLCIMISLQTPVADTRDRETELQIKMKQKDRGREKREIYKGTMTINQRVFRRTQVGRGANRGARTRLGQASRLGQVEGWK